MLPAAPPRRTASSVRRLALGLGLALILLAASGCLALGNLGNYRFGVELPTATPTEARTTFDLMEGMDATFLVETARATVPRFTRAVSSDPGALEVLRTDDRHVTVRAAREGSAMLWVYAADGTSDYVDVRIRKAADVRLSAPPLAFGDGTAAVIVGEQVRLRVRVEDARGHELLAPAGVPVHVERADVDSDDGARRDPPAGIGGVVPPFFSESVDVVFREPGRVRLRGDVGDGVVLDVIRADDVESFSVEDVTGRLFDAQIAKRGDVATGASFVVLVPFVTVQGVREPLLSRAVDVRLLTPEVCAPVPLVGPFASVLASPGAYLLSVKPGRCQVDLSALGRSTTFVYGAVPSSAPSAAAPPLRPLPAGAPRDPSDDGADPDQDGAGEDGKDRRP